MEEEKLLMYYDEGYNKATKTATRKIRELGEAIGDVPAEYLMGLNDAIMIILGSSVDEVVEFRKKDK